MNPWAILAIAVALILVGLWLAAELDRWHRGRRRRGVGELDDFSKLSQPPRDRRPW